MKILTTQKSLLLLVAVVLLFYAPFAFAENENLKCTEAGNPSYDFSCPLGQKSKKAGKTCGIGLITTYSKGTCKCVVEGKCEALTASGTDGKGMNVNPGSLMQLLDGVMKLMNSLKGGEGSGGSDSGSGGFGGTGMSGCAQYYQVSTPSNDPCAYYVPNVSSSIDPTIDTGAGDSTGGSAGGTSAADLISSLLGGSSGDGGSAGGGTGAGSGGATSSSGGVGVGGTTAISSSTASSTRAVGVSGEIRVLPNGATIVVSNPNAQGNSIVAGFLGTQAGGGAQPQGLVATWCRTRPWATNFLSVIIPPTFFDNLCGLRGYKVGEDASAPGPTQVGSQVTLTQQRITAPKPTATTSVVAPPVPPSPPMTVDIWAVPPSVMLGSRTTVFWTSKNAAECTETSPDGSFSHSSLSGGGATVPLSGPTTFTISCTAPDGTHATDFVTVNLSI